MGFFSRISNLDVLAGRYPATEPPQGTRLDKQTVQALVALGNDLRRLKDHDLDEAASTRLLIYAALMIRSGLPAAEACRVCLAQPLSDDSETLAALERLIQEHF